jgi:PAS domain S-box-containing protein
MDVTDTIRNLSPGDHLCCMYQTEQEHRATLAPFISTGLEQGHKVIYIVDARTAETVFGLLDREGVPTAEPIRTGQLQVSDSRDTYTRNGSFDPESMLQLLRSETEKSLNQGYAALRVTGEMSWALHGLPGSERLMEYEAKLNQFFPTNQAIGLCQYDMRRFESEVLLDVLATHPIAIVRNKGYDNIYYLPPEEFLGPNRAEAELQRRLRNLEDRQQAEESFRRSEEQARREAEFATAVFDTAGALIVVLDASGRIVRFNRTCERLTGYTEVEVRGRSLWELFIPEQERMTTQSVFEELRAGRFPARLENDWLTKSGDRIRVAWSNTCTLDAAGGVDLVISIGLDVTEAALIERARQREFSSLEKYSEASETSTTSSSLGVASLSQSRPKAFSQTVAELEQLMDLAVEESMYKVRRDVSGQLRQMAEQLSRLEAGPKDVVQAYVQALEHKTGGLKSTKARAYTDEGRLLLLELMGYLAASYHNRCLGRSNHAAGTRRASP